VAGGISRPTTPIRSRSSATRCTSTASTTTTTARSAPAGRSRTAVR
jgi:hypothetical protein